MKKILITGTTGMLGKDICGLLIKNEEYSVYSINRSKDTSIVGSYGVDLCDYKKVYNIVSDIEPDVIIHTAAVVDVDFCEKNRDVAFEINVNASKHLASLTKRIIFISTDSVYGGIQGDYKESDIKRPLNFYAETKSKAEDEIVKANSNSIILRTNLYGYHVPVGNSLFEWGYSNLSQGVQIKGFSDVLFNPLYTRQLATVVDSLLCTSFSGVLNIGCNESLSKYEYLVKMAKIFKLDESLIIPVSIDAGFLNAKRPKNTVLNVDKMKNLIGLRFSIDTGLTGLCSDFCQDLTSL